jgi:hypothetical protein
LISLLSGTVPALKSSAAALQMSRAVSAAVLDTSTHSELASRHFLRDIFGLANGQRDDR